MVKKSVEGLGAISSSSTKTTTTAAAASAGCRRQDHGCKQKDLAVVGSTPQERRGEGLVRKILAEKKGPFAVCALTRDPSKDSAQALAMAGAEVVGL